MHKEAGRGREEKKDPSGSTCTTEHQERVEEQAGACGQDNWDWFVGERKVGFTKRTAMRHRRVGLSKDDDAKNVRAS